MTKRPRPRKGQKKRKSAHGRSLPQYPNAIQNGGGTREEIIQYIGTSYFPDEYGPISVALPGYDQTGFSAVDRVAYDMQIGQGNWMMVKASTQINVGAFACAEQSLGTNLTNVSIPIPPVWQFPSLNGTNRVALRSVTMKFSIRRNTITDPIEIIVGLDPEDTLYSEKTAASYNEAELENFKGVRTFAGAQLVAGEAQIIAWHRYSPLADQFKESLSMTTAVADVGRRGKTPIAPAVNPRRDLSKMKSAFRFRQEELPGAPGDNYNPTLDCGLPFIAVLNNSAGNGAEVTLTITRTWEVIFHPYDSAMIPTKFGNSGPKIGQRALDIANKIIQHVPVMPNSPTPETAVNKVVDTVLGGGQDLIDWTESPSGKKTLETAVSLFGTGVAVGSAVLPMVL